MESSVSCSWVKGVDIRGSFEGKGKDMSDCET
jgi:hypothetical protein